MQAPQNLYPSCHAGIVSEITPTGPKVITARRLNFNPIFERSLLKIVGGPLSPVRCGLASLGQSKLHHFIEAFPLSDFPFFDIF